MVEGKDLAEEMIDVYAKLDWGDLPPNIIEVTKIFILDTIGTLIAGTTAPGSKMIFDLIKEWGGREEATILIYGAKVPAPNAAFVNSTMAHARDFDDTHDKAVLHANVSVLPAAIAMSEYVGGISGKELITAVTIGVDFMCRLGLGLKGIKHWILSSTLGYFGATLAASKILGLDEERMLNALGIVYSQVAGNVQCLIDGGLTKRMQPAFAARAAVFSSILAKAGITGARKIFEGEHGFFITYENGEYDREVIVKELGKRFEVANLSMKFYPCCRATHPAIDATLEIVRLHEINPEDIDEILVHVTPLVHNLVGRPFELRASPQVDAQFSIPYTVATAILKKDVFIEDFEDEVIISAKDRHRLARKVKVIPDQQPLEDSPLLPCCVEIKLTNGRTYSKYIDAIRGSPKVGIRIQDAVEKFKKCTRFSVKPLKEELIDEIIETILHLEKIQNLNEVVELLA